MTSFTPSSNSITWSNNVQEVCPGEYHQKRPCAYLALTEYQCDAADLNLEMDLVEMKQCAAHSISSYLNMHSIQWAETIVGPLSVMALSMTCWLSLINSIGFWEWSIVYICQESRPTIGPTLRASLFTRSHKSLQSMCNSPTKYWVVEPSWSN